MSKKVIAVLFGGVSSEHDISLISASSVLRNIPADQYDVIRIGITRDGRWVFYNGSIDGISDTRWEAVSYTHLDVYKRQKMPCHC